MSLTVFCFLALSVTVSGVAAFGAGNIPSYGALEGVAFRHGDIEDILLQLAMVPVTSGTSGFLSSLNPLSSAGKKFNAMAVKRVYFGNWLRDYSQAVDVGTLSKGLDPKTIRLLVWVMGFMAFGYATEEFEVTNARLGVYRPEEHIDNPKGYPNPEEPDARKFDSRLRGPVQAAELEVDTQTGMKNYIANERGGWMTSASYIRNSLLRCIELGREHAANHNDIVRFESLRVLGQALHTLEDFSAHSNFCELVLNDLGYSDVFPQVGTSTAINLNGKMCYPLTTGTFGGLDFVHSLLGEATDKISQTQISEVANGLSSSSTQGSSGLLNSLQSMTSKIPGFALPREMEDISREADAIRSNDNSRANIGYTVDTDADAIAQKIYPIMAFRDRIMKGLSAFFDKIPGLSALVDEISETLTVWVLATIEPFMRPIVEKVTAGLGAGQSLVTAKDDQLAVFENPHCSDPTHSMLAKDHFSCYLNHPAGLIGQAVVKHAVIRITAAWHDTRIEPHALIAEILEVLHHPASAHGRTTIQREMREIVNSWVNNLGSKKSKVLQGLSFNGVKQGQHHEGGTSDTTGVLANHSHSHTTSSQYGPGRQTMTSQSDIYQNTKYHEPVQSRMSHGNSYDTQTRPSSHQITSSGAASSYYDASRQNFENGVQSANSYQTMSDGLPGQASTFDTERLSNSAGGSNYSQNQGYQSFHAAYDEPGTTRPYGHSTNDYMSGTAHNTQHPQTYGDSEDWTRPQPSFSGYSAPADNQYQQSYGSQTYHQQPPEQYNYGRQ